MKRARLWALQARYSPYLFVSPFVILFCTFLIYPLGRSLMLGFYKTAGPRNQIFIGIENYLFLFRDELFWVAVGNTTLYVIMYLSIQIPASLGLAMLLNSKFVHARSFFRFAFFSTHLVGQVFVAVLFAQILSVRGGLLNGLLSLLTGQLIQINWIGDPYLARISLVIASLWLSVGFGMIYFLAALQAVDQELYEAADVDGAGKWARFMHITIPGIKPVLLFMILVGTIGAFQLFELPWVLFQQSAGPANAGLTIVSYLYIAAFQGGDLGYASAIGWMLVLIVLMIVATFRLLGFGKET
ncbi:MAG TPA: sugar ABC transporter permease [Tepidisphaeraceae bacterium]|nr:sugar ABC transporter permease [Tepidisphaeraceae bacterium]